MFQNLKSRKLKKKHYLLRLVTQKVTSYFTYMVIRCFSLLFSLIKTHCLVVAKIEATSENFGTFHFSVTKRVQHGLRHKKDSTDSIKTNRLNNRMMTVHDDINRNTFHTHSQSTILDGDVSRNSNNIQHNQILKHNAKLYILVQQEHLFQEQNIQNSSKVSQPKGKLNVFTVV